ncbi:MAG TPA: hypothetical protein PKB03_00135 [Baekduia sp.]|nr:hypothetical protein [Baekduia sp.]
MKGTAITTVGTATLVAVLTLAVLAEPALAAQGGHLPVAVLGIGLDDLNPLKWVGEGLGKAKDVVLGPLKLGAKEIAHLIGTIVLAILDMLIPDWVVTAGPKVIAWIVEVENWGRSNGTIYRSINGLQDTLKWIGIALMTSGGTWSALRVVAGHEALEDVLRAWATALFGIVLFRWAWGEGVAVTNAITELILTQPGVASGLTGLVAVVGGTSIASSGGLVLPLLMIVAVIVFIGLLAAKTMLLIVGALVYVTGQFAFALRVWPAGPAILKAWSSLATAVFLIPLAWTLIFAVGGVMIVDALRAGAGGVIELNVGQVFQAWMLAIAAIMTIIAAIKAAQAIFGMAKMAPLALISSMGSGTILSSGGAGRSSAGSGKTTDLPLGAGSAGQAAQSLRSNSERSMDSANGEAPVVGNKQNLKVQVAQLAGTYVGGPAGGAAAAAVTQHISKDDQQPGESSGENGPSGAAEAVPSPGGAPSPAEGVTQTVDAAAQAATEPADTGPPSPADSASESPDPSATDAGGPSPEIPNDSPPAGPATPSDPNTNAPSAQPQPPIPTGATAATSHVNGNGATTTTPPASGVPAEQAAQAVAGAPAAPAAANRSVAGLPADDASQAFGAAPQPASNGGGQPSKTQQIASQPDRPERQPAPPVATAPQRPQTGGGGDE